MEYRNDGKRPRDGDAALPGGSSSAGTNIVAPIPTVKSAPNKPFPFQTFDLSSNSALDQSEYASTSRNADLPTNFPMTRAPTYVLNRDADPAAAQIQSRAGKETVSASPPEEMIGDEPYDPVSLYGLPHLDGNYQYAGHTSQGPRATATSSTGHPSEHDYPPRLSTETRPYCHSISGPNISYHGGDLTDSTAYAHANTYDDSDYIKPSSVKTISEDGHITGGRPLVMIRCPAEDSNGLVGYKLSKDRMAALQEVDQAVFSQVYLPHEQRVYPG